LEGKKKFGVEGKEEETEVSRPRELICEVKLQLL
jgi:hypothetical protein